MIVWKPLYEMSNKKWMTTMIVYQSDGVKYAAKKINDHRDLKS